MTRRTLQMFLEACDICNPVSVIWKWFEDFRMEITINYAKQNFDDLPHRRDKIAYTRSHYERTIFENDAFTSNVLWMGD